MSEPLEVHEVEVRQGEIWRVLKRGDRICIVDSRGRSRHKSRGHENTAITLASMLADRRFDSAHNVDAALRLAAQRFESGESE